MSRLWRPETYNHQGELEIPLHDVTLDSGLKLRFLGITQSGSIANPVTMAAYERDGLRVLASVDHTPRWGPLLHVSLSRQDTDPSWREIRMVKAAFFGDTVDAMMVLPRAEDYVNQHPHCFHLWQTPEGWRLQ